MMNEQELKDTIRSIPDYPIPGVLFRDITTLVKDPEAYNSLITILSDELRPLNVDIVIGPEARGFVFGAAVAYAINAGLVLARKPVNLSCEVNRISYCL
jgi:adenine phosphoribosyltransferase